MKDKSKKSTYSTTFGIDPNFFQMRFIENLSFALKNGFKKFFSKVAV